jgi:hypothetical protein
LSSLTQDTILTEGSNSHEIGTSNPTNSTDGFEKSGSQTGFFVYSESPYSLWLKGTGGWTLHQTFTSATLIAGTNYAWGDYTAAYVQTSVSGHVVHLKPRTGAILVDGNIGDGINQHDTLVRPGTSTGAVNITTTQIVPSSGVFTWDGQNTGLALQAGEFSWSGEAVYDAITSITFHKTDANGTDQSSFLNQYLHAKSGQIRVNLDAHPGHRSVYQIVGANLDANGHYKFDVFNVSLDEIAVTSGDCTVYFVLVGEQGPAGADGAEGPAGPQGPAGANGTSGDMGGTMTTHIIPDTNAAYDLGNAEYKIRHLFLSDNSMYIGDTWIKAEGDSVKMENLLVGDLNLNNTGRQNEVDGTSGHWSIQEGAEDLFLINRTTGKKYRFNITEVEEN